MARYAYVNGRYVDHREASVHIEDRGYQLADGVYEVVGVRDGKLIDETPHIDRLDRSLRELRIDWPVARPALGFIMRELMRRNRLRDGLVYMQVTRGVARRDHAFPTTPVKPALVLTTKNTKHLGADPGPGVAVKSQPDIRWERCDIKTVALLPNVLAKQAARESGAYEAWLIDDKGNITEGASTNAWIVTADNELVTRQTDNGILAGITRGTLKKIAGDLQLKFVERPFTLAEAKKAKEAFITSATSFVTPVVKIDGDDGRRRQGRPDGAAAARGICALRVRGRGGHVSRPADIERPKAILFDWDNTLVEHLADHHRVLSRHLHGARPDAVDRRRRCATARTARCATISPSCSASGQARRRRCSTRPSTASISSG